MRPRRCRGWSGSTITAAYWFTSSTSFANPAVTLARGFTTTFAGIALGDVPGFILAQLIGAAIAVPVAMTLFPPAEARGGGRRAERAVGGVVAGGISATTFTHRFATSAARAMAKRVAGPSRDTAKSLGTSLPGANLAGESLPMVDSSDRVPIEPQSILAPLSRAAIFLVVSIGGTADAVRKVRGVIADIGGLLRTVGFRDLQGRLSCNVAIGSAAWDRFGQPRRPAQLRPFAEIRGPAHTAVATPGDLLFHIRANRADMCFELERLILEALGDAVTVADEVHGFRYFDSRDLLGFVDGTENPTGADLTQSALIQSEDPAFAGGSYVVVQKYLHKLDQWRALETATQQSIIGRTKADNVELEDAPGGNRTRR